MGKEVVCNKFTWVIKGFSSSETGCFYSDRFVSGGCRWILSAYKGLTEPDHFDLYLEVADYYSLPPGWRRNARCNLTIVNRNPEKSFKRNETQRWFSQSLPDKCFPSLISLSKLVAEDGGFLVNNEIKIVAEVEVLQVIGKLDVAEAATRPLKKTKLNVDGAVSSDLHEETIDVDGFKVLPFQVDSVRRIFQKHPEIALGFRPKNLLLKATCMNVLLSLTGILRQLPREISKPDLAYAYGLLSSLKDAGLKVDWLEKKVNELSEKKEKEKACKIRMQEIRKEWKDLKAKVLAAQTPITSDDVV